MQFGGTIAELSGDLPSLEYAWDAHTEILSGSFVAPRDGQGYTGSVEFEDERGAVVTLDVHSGLFCGLDVVVWPKTVIVDDLVAPTPNRRGVLAVSDRPSQPGIAVLEIDIPIAARKNEDGSVIHLRLGNRDATDRVHVADKLLLDLDGFGDLAGVWLSDVPRCPRPSP